MERLLIQAIVWLGNLGVSGIGAAVFGLSAYFLISRRWKEHTIPTPILVGVLVGAVVFYLIWNNGAVLMSRVLPGYF